MDQEILKTGLPDYHLLILACYFSKINQLLQQKTLERHLPSPDLPLMYSSDISEKVRNRDPEIKSLDKFPTTYEKKPI